MDNSQKIYEWREKLKNWLKNPYNLTLVLLIIFTIIIRMYYFFKLGEQPIWWDEGDYLSIAKIWATGQATPEWWSHFTGMRPLLMPLIWAGMFKLGLSELAIRFMTILLPSILSIYLIYLLGKSLYNERIGLIAGFMLSFYWSFMFYSFRLLTDIPATCLGLAALYFFSEGYFKQSNPKKVYLAFFFGILAFYTRFPLALIPISIGSYMFILQRFSLFTDKTFWKAIGISIISIIPFIIYVINTKLYFIKFFFIEGIGGQAESGVPFGWYVLKLSLTLIKPFWIVAFLIGFLTMITLIISLDLFLKRRAEHLKADAFILMLVLIQLIFYILVFRGATDRWIFLLTAIMIIIAAKGLDWIYLKLGKHGRIIGFAFMALLLIGGGYQNMVTSNQIINEKKDSYQEIKWAGEWLEDNTQKNSKVITASIVQNQYYSKRQSYDFYTNATIWTSCVDYLGRLSNNESCQNETEAEFEKKVQELKPDYMIISVFEPAFTPQWAYMYPQKHNMTAVRAYVNSQNQPLLIIYKFN